MREGNNMARGTPNLLTMNQEIRDRWNVKIGIYACRPTNLGGGRTGGPSQHAWENASDIFVPDPRKPLRPVDRDRGLTLDSGDEINTYLKANKDRLGVQQILWRARSQFTGNSVSNHWNHLHVVPWPKGIGTPPCMGGTLQVKHEDGTIGNSFGNEPSNEEEFMSTEELQEALNAAGRRDQNGEALDPDGVYGKKTTFAFVSALTKDETSGTSLPLQVTFTGSLDAA